MLSEKLLKLRPVITVLGIITGVELILIGIGQDELAEILTNAVTL